MNPIQTERLATAISDRLNSCGYETSPKDVSKRLNDPKMLVGDSYRLVKEQLVPAAIYYAGQLYSWYVGNNEVPKTAIEDRKIEAVAVEPQMTVVAKPGKKVEPEDEFFDPEWDGFLDTDYKDPEGTMVASGISAQSKDEKTVEEAPVAPKKVEAEVKQKKTDKKSGPEVGFGSHIPRPIKRKGEMDAEFINKVQSNLRAVEDPFKPKKVRKVRSFSRLNNLAKAKVRTEDKHLSNHQIEMNFRNSLRK